MIDCDIDEHIAVVTIDNPAANTFTGAGLEQLSEVIAKLNSDMNVYAMVITGHGEKFFSAGADLKALADGDKVQARHMARRFSAAFEALQEARPVTIAAINGYAMGGGLEYTISCDLRIGEEQGKMQDPIASIGVLPSC